MTIVSAFEDIYEYYSLWFGTNSWILKLLAFKQVVSGPNILPVFGSEWSDPTSHTNPAMSF